MPLPRLDLPVVVGRGAVAWPGVVAPSRPREPTGGVDACMLAAFSLPCLLGLRYSLQLLPALFSISQTGCGSRRSPLSPTNPGPCSEAGSQPRRCERRGARTNDVSVIAALPFAL